MTQLENHLTQWSGLLDSFPKTLDRHKPYIMLTRQTQWRAWMCPLRSLNNASLLTRSLQPSVQHGIQPSPVGFDDLTGKLLTRSKEDRPDMTIKRLMAYNKNQFNQALCFLLKLFLKIHLFLCVRVSYLNVCVCTTCVLGAHKSQRELGAHPLGLCRSKFSFLLSRLFSHECAF